MSKPTTPVKRNPTNKKNMTSISNLKALHEDNNNTSKATDRLQARQFASWYKRMIDDQRQNLGLYLTDDAVLEWFGRTIRTRKKVSTFLKFDMQCSRHDFTTVDSINQILTRQDRIERNSISQDGSLASPLASPEIMRTRSETKTLTCNVRKRPAIHSSSGSPEWDKNCHHKDEKVSECKRKKPNEEIIPRDDDSKRALGMKGISCGIHFNTDSEGSEINSKGDGDVVRKVKRKCVQVTPPNFEVGQGDCLPSTSGDELSHAALNAQLPKKAIECNGYIEFVRKRNSRSTDTMKWERKCKLQISYSQDPLNVGEYIIWAIHYTDDSKCRRNLLAAFEEVSAEKQVRKS